MCTAQRKRLCRAISRNQNTGKKSLERGVIKVIIDEPVVLPDNIAKINGGPMKKGKVSGSPKKGRAAPAPAVPQPTADDSTVTASNDALQESAGTTLTK